MSEVNKTKIDRPKKTDVNLYIAWTIKELSCDGQTKHGCVITTKDNRPLGWGYNSFPRDCDNNQLPNLRGDGSVKGPLGCKYAWIIHAERNAVTNCTLKPVDGVAYVTGLCCFDCIVHLWQNGVNMIYQLDRDSEMLKDGQDEELKTELLNHIGRIRPKRIESQTMETLSIITVKANFTFSLGIQAEAKRLKLIHDERERAGRCFDNI